MKIIKIVCCADCPRFIADFDGRVCKEGCNLYEDDYEQVDLDFTEIDAITEIHPDCPLEDYGVKR